MVHGGADLIDCKEPNSGALGALQCAEICKICQSYGQSYGKSHQISATIGDDAVVSRDLEDRVAQIAKTGVDFIKIGFDRHIELDRVAERLAGLETGNAKLVAVLLADNGVDMDCLVRLADAGFVGVMLDTADKSAGSLPEIVEPGILQSFIAKAHQLRMFAGLAGSLRARDIKDLARYRPDILGFRGALCSGDSRRNPIDPAAVQTVRALIRSEIALNKAN